MPIHDWKRVTEGTWHAFHLSWISEIQLALNGGILPNDYYAQAEQFAGPLGPDVLTLQTADAEGTDFSTNGTGHDGSNEPGGVAVATAPPRPKLTDEAEIGDYLFKRRTIAVRHSSDDRIIALLELVSPGNKQSRHAIRTFTDKAVEALYRGFHLVIVDLFPPTPRDPSGIHAAIWGEFSDTEFVMPANERTINSCCLLGRFAEACIR